MGVGSVGIASLSEQYRSCHTLETRSRPARHIAFLVVSRTRSALETRDIDHHARTDESDGDTIADSLDTLSDRVEVLEEANGTPPDHHQTTETTIEPIETTDPPKLPSDGISCRPRVTGAVNPFDGPTRSPSNAHGRSTGRPPSEVRSQTPPPIRIARVSGPPGTHGPTRTASAERP